MNRRPGALYRIWLVVLGLAAIAWWALDRDDPVGPDQPSRNDLRVPAVGCWALFMANGRPAEGRMYWAPAVAQLRPNRTVGRFDSSGHALPQRESYGTWAADLHTDTIRITMTSGFSGSVFVLRMPEDRPRDTLYGRGYERWDHTRPSRRGSVFATRRPCPG